MALIEIKRDPSVKDLRVLAIGVPAFFAVVTALARRSPGALGGAAVFTGVCFVVAALAGRGMSVREKAWGVLFPVVFGAAWAGVRWPGPGAVMISAGVLGLAGAIGAVSAAGPAVYSAWMRAAWPVGWVVSHALLAAVYFGVITPIGVVLRLAGRDLLGMRIDRSAASYWRVRGSGEGGRYFRQW